MNGKTIRLSATQEFLESVVRTWVYYSVLGMLGFRGWQTKFVFISMPGDDARYVVLRLQANGRVFEIVAAKWNLTGGEFELAWREFNSAITNGKVDNALLSRYWTEMFDDSDVGDIPVMIRNAGIVVPLPDGLDIIISAAKDSAGATAGTTAGAAAGTKEGQSVRSASNKPRDLSIN